tara:strand:+ start:3392 stop:4576 length:1185 start_codon:yes stop_codon:yes gene_type:complete
MAIEILQYPASASLAQSPIICAVSESLTGTIASSSFQYIGELYYWTGSVNDSGSLPQFTLAKFPNASLTGIFDFSKIINSTLEDTVEQNPSQVTFLKGDFYHQYITQSAFVTGSHVETGIYKALDGYALYQEPITQSLEDKSPHYPILTDGPTTQSYFTNNAGEMGVWIGAFDVGTYADKIAISGSDGTSFEVAYTSNGNSEEMIGNFPIGPNQSSWTIDADLPYYTIQAKYLSAYLGEPLRFELACEKKYPNVRLKWKNRFGQFDYLNFNLASKESFRTANKTFQRQIGTWDATSLTYDKADSATQNYAADTTQTLTVNSDWLDEDYNEILKQFMVSDEIYWVYDESAGQTTEGSLRPITIQTNSIQFKTRVVDKLIQYSFDFNYGQAYKLIL